MGIGKIMHKARKLAVKDLFCFECARRFKDIMDLIEHERNHANRKKNARLRNQIKIPRLMPDEVKELAHA